MKNSIKKLFAMALALCMVLSLAACGSGGTTSSSNPNPGSSETASAPQGGNESTGSNNDADGNGRADKVVYASTMAYPSLNPFLNPKTFTSAVYEPLGAYETYGDKFGGLLMESWEHPDDLTYIYKLM